MEQLKNINTAFKLVKTFCLIIIILCFSSIAMFYYFSEKKVNTAREKIYVLTNGDALEFALSKNIEENRPAEIKNHIESFHRFFYELDPDPKEILNRIDRALVLIGDSGEKLHSSRKEGLYYHKIVEGNISTRIFVDSILVDTSKYPYKAAFYGKQKLIRTSKILYKNLIASCQLRNINRSDDNPHGLYIENYKLLNIDTIDEKSRN